MKLSLVKSDILKSTSECLVFFIPQKSGAAKGLSVDHLPKKIAANVNKTLTSLKFTANAQSTLFFPQLDAIKGRRVLFVGTGPLKEFDTEDARQTAAAAYKVLDSEGVKSVDVFLDSLGLDADAAPDFLKAMAEGLLLATYRFKEFQNKSAKNGKGSKDKKVSPQQIRFISAANMAQATDLLREATVTCEATNFARWLGDMPGNHMTPTRLGAEVKKQAQGSKLKVTVWDQARIVKEKMGSFLSVARGSSEPPRFIVMEYKGAAASATPICFVGKGLTFDSGGISIKPAQGMEEMKYDMCGGAAVIATMLAISRLGLKVNAYGFVPATENMPGPAANKPGDIVIARNGISIEVNNTDAEGRLILADALVYASEHKPAWICDAATLTGAMMIALGNVHTGFFTRNDTFAEKVNAAARVTGEKVWRMPVDDAHSEDMKGTYADLSNVSSSRGAGSATAAAFLENFVAKGIPYAHFDIAGTAWNAGNRAPYNPKKGATGAIVRTFIELAKSGPDL